MISISRDSAAKIDLTKKHPELILCRVAKNSIEEQLAGQNIDLSHCVVVDAASTQINMIENGNGVGVISELMLSTIPNGLVRGEVRPKMEIEISLVANDFDEIPPAAKEMSEMILQRAQ